MLFLGSYFFPFTKLFLRVNDKKKNTYLLAGCLPSLAGTFSHVILNITYYLMLNEMSVLPYSG